jgi:hypothetical protein
MICQECGFEGEIEVPGINGVHPSAIQFRHLGHNPFSGNMHYQCPFCRIVLLVDPMTILAGFISGYSRVDMRDTGVTTMGQLPHGKALL